MKYSASTSMDLIADLFVFLHSLISLIRNRTVWLWQMSSLCPRTIRRRH